MSKFREWRYHQASRRSWTQFLRGRITIIGLRNELWHHWLRLNGGLNNVNKTMTPEEIRKKRDDIKNEIHIVLREYTSI